MAPFRPPRPRLLPACLPARVHGAVRHGHPRTSNSRCGRPRGAKSAWSDTHGQPSRPAPGHPVSLEMAVVSSMRQVEPGRGRGPATEGAVSAGREKKRPVPRARRVPRPRGALPACQECMRGARLENDWAASWLTAHTPSALPTCTTQHSALLMQCPHVRTPRALRRPGTAGAVHLLCTRSALPPALHTHSSCSARTCALPELCFVRVLQGQCTCCAHAVQPCLHYTRTAYALLMQCPRVRTPRDVRGRGHCRGSAPAVHTQCSPACTTHALHTHSSCSARTCTPRALRGPGTAGAVLLLCTRSAVLPALHTHYS
jgi:hypothetical protein